MDSQPEVRSIPSADLRIEWRDVLFVLLSAPLVVLILQVVSVHAASTGFFPDPELTQSQLEASYTVWEDTLIHHIREEIVEEARRDQERYPNLYSQAGKPVMVVGNFWTDRPRFVSTVVNQPVEMPLPESGDRVNANAMVVLRAGVLSIETGIFGTVDIRPPTFQVSDASGTGSGWHLQIRARPSDSQARNISDLVSLYTIALPSENIHRVNGEGMPTSRITVPTRLSTHDQELAFAEQGEGMGRFLMKMAVENAFPIEPELGLRDLPLVLSLVASP